MFEVAGNATIPVNPLSIEEIKNAIEKLLTDKKSRERLINKGFEQAKKFSWKKTAEETLKIYENYSRK
jgi:glycosyltransferase involved in cell wall biosynthesis